MRYSTIIFDFDGTLADTLEESRRIYNLLAPDYSLRAVSAEELPGLRHFSLLELLDHLDIPKRRVPSLLSKGTSMMRGNITRLPLIPGIGEILPAMRSRAKSFGVPSYIAHFGQRYYSTSLRRAGLARRKLGPNFE